MIEIGKNFLFGFSSARQTGRAQKEKYRILADQTEEQARQLRQDYDEKTTYLFRSATEKMRLAQATAQEALAQRQARRAAHGINDLSASAAQDASTQQLAGVLEDSATQRELQTAAAQEENSFKKKWQALLNAAAAYRSSAHKSGRLGSLGRAFISLLK